MHKRRILIGLSLLKPVSTIGDKNNLSRGGRGETRTGTFFTGGYGRHGSEWGILRFGTHGLYFVTEGIIFLHKVCFCCSADYICVKINLNYMRILLTR